MSFRIKSGFKPSQTTEFQIQPHNNVSWPRNLTNVNPKDPWNTDLTTTNQSWSAEFSKQSWEQEFKALDNHEPINQDSTIKITSDDALSKTAGVIADLVSSSANKKLRDSKFLDLMVKLRFTKQRIVVISLHILSLLRMMMQSTSHQLRLILAFVD